MRSRHRHLPPLAYRARRARRLPQLSDERLPAALEAAAIRRQAEAGGGFATIVHKGDPDRGSLILAFVERGEHRALVERALAPDGRYRWQQCGPTTGLDGAKIAEFAEKRRRFDPDHWWIELDIPDHERFIAILAGQG